MEERSTTGAPSLAGFRSAGRTLFSLGLVKGAEGNLSTFDGNSLAITRTGATLADLSEADVLTGELDAELPGASSDLEVHRNMYRGRGGGAVGPPPPRPGRSPKKEEARGSMGCTPSPARSPKRSRRWRRKPDRRAPMG